ncbi:7464_t:CDS:2 [Acaulospora morrowiae]|uniref:7464_t:CDS:1 n=1 Tax=Acaulospora morrowiae TaxID=94023 RepID=A0A9N8VKP8_9GLOM|nr:7464_t:CDS:2 [Acaulospora morrowiae]
MTLIDENVPDMVALGQAMTTAIERFSKFKSVRIKNSNEAAKRVEEINTQRLKFREFASDSIKQSSKLSRYAEDVLDFAECCMDNRFSKEDLLKLLKLRLNDAKQNREMTEELQLKIKHIIDDLKVINTHLVKYVDEIKKNPRLLDSETEKKLSEKEAVKERFSVSSKANASIAAFGIIASCIAAPFSGGTSVAAAIAATCVDAGIFVTTAGSSLALGTGLLANAESSKISNLDRKLKSERDRLIDDIRGLNEGLIDIVDTCRKFSSFWEEQTEVIINFINKLESLNDQGGIQSNRMISNAFLNKWKNVDKTCKEFNRQIWSQLDSDTLLRIEVN